MTGQQPNTWTPGQQAENAPCMAAPTRARGLAGETLVIYKPDPGLPADERTARAAEDQLHARKINLHILTGICAGIHRPDGAAIADKMMFMVAAMAAEMERDLIREGTIDGAAPRRGPGPTWRPPARRR